MTTRCESRTIATNKGFGGEFKVIECNWKDGTTTYDVYANIGTKRYNYNGFTNIKSAFAKMKKYQMKAMELATR